MADGEEQKPSASEQEAEKDEKLILGKFKSEEEAQKSLDQGQAKITELSGQMARLKQQAEAYGMTVDDEGNMVAATPQYDPQNPYGNPYGTQYWQQPPEPDLETKVAGLEQTIAELKQGQDMASRMMVDGPRQQVLADVPPEAQERAGQIFDEMVGQMPAAQRMNPRAMTAVRRMVKGQLLEEKVALGGPPQQTTRQTQQDIPSLSEPSGEMDEEATPRLTSTSKEVQEGFKGELAEMGIEWTPEKQAKGEQAARARKARPK